MIRPRRTFQERNFQLQQNKFKPGNKFRRYFRYLFVFCIVSFLFIAYGRTSLVDVTGITPKPSKTIPEYQHQPVEEFTYTFGEELHKEDSEKKNPVADSKQQLQQPMIQVGKKQQDQESPPLPPTENALGDELMDEALSEGAENPPESLDENIEKVGDEKQLVDESERSTEAEQEEEEESDETEKPVSSSSDGVVGGPEFGGTFDGTDMVIFPQITLPDQPILQHYDSTQNYWPLHAILRERGWSYATMALPSRVTMWISRGSVPPRLKQGYQMLNSMGVSGCIGGAKSLQLECRRRLARLHGCEYDVLKIQPPQYNMLNLDDCKRFFTDAEKPERANQVYLSKPTYTFHGAGIRIHQGALGSLKTEFGTCKTPKNMILMDYVSNPATMMGGYKFDFRTYLLVASLKPQLVFYHDGFVRKSDKMFDLRSKDLNVHITNKVTQSKEEHFFNFTTLEHELHKDLGLPPDHVQKYVRPRAKAVSRFLFQTTLVQPQPPRHVAGRFHLFGIDWLLDAKGKLHLLEGNGYPLVTNYPGIGLTPKIWEEMTDLILALQTKPSIIKDQVTVKNNFHFGGWHLVFNELEEAVESINGRAYDSCKEFTN